MLAVGTRLGCCVAGGRGARADPPRLILVPLSAPAGQAGDRKTNHPTASSGVNHAVFRGDWLGGVRPLRLLWERPILSAETNPRGTRNA